MSKLSDKLEKILTEQLNYPCKIWFSRSESPRGWMFSTDQTYPQRIGWTYAEAIKFVQPHKNWEWLRDTLSNIKE